MTGERAAKQSAEARPRDSVPVIHRLTAWLRRMTAATDDPDSVIAFFRSLR
jgi:hypothetical protein